MHYTVFHVQQQYFKRRYLKALFEEAGSGKPNLETVLDANRIDVYTDFPSKVDDSSKEARMSLMQKRMVVLSGGGENTDLLNMVADGIPLPDRKASELTGYRKTAHILSDSLYKRNLTFYHEHLLII